MKPITARRTISYTVIVIMTLQGCSVVVYERLFVKYKNSSFYDIFDATYAYLAK